EPDISRERQSGGNVSPTVPILSGSVGASFFSPPFAGLPDIRDRGKSAQRRPKETAARDPVESCRAGTTSSFRKFAEARGGWRDMLAPSLLFAPSTAPRRQSGAAPYPKRSRGVKPPADRRIEPNGGGLLGRGNPGLIPLFLRPLRRGVVQL